jgi:hypothetical protein
MSPMENGDLVKITAHGKYYKHGYARVGPFLTAFVRKRMSDIIFPIKEHVYRCHTDGFISDISLDHIKISDKLGDFKIEKQGKCHIKNACKIDWN